MINTKESRAGAMACIEGMNELEKNMGNPLGDDLYEQHLKDVNNGIQFNKGRSQIKGRQHAQFLRGLMICQSCPHCSAISSVG